MPPVAEGLGGRPVVAVVAEEVVMAMFEASAVAVEFCGKRRRLEDKERVVEEDLWLGAR